MHTFTLPAAAVQAISLFKATKDIRCYLNGVHVYTKGSAIVLEGSEGNSLARHTVRRPDGLPEFNFILDFNAIKLEKKLLDVQLKTDDFIEFTLTSGNTSVTTKAIAGTFPDTDRVIPLATTGEVAQFDPELLLVFKKALKLLTGGDTYFEVKHNGLRSGLIQAESVPNFIGVVMPWRKAGSAA